MPSAMTEQMMTEQMAEQAAPMTVTSAATRATPAATRTTPPAEAQKTTSRYSRSAGGATGGATDWRATLTEVSDLGRRLGWRPVLAALAALLALAVVIYLLGVRSGMPAPISLPQVGTNPAVSLAPAAPLAAPKDVLVVHIDGEVVTPGVYEIESPARLEALIKTAGGLTPQADTTRINLAQLLSDSDRLVVPTIGQPLPAGSASAGGFSQAGSGGDAVININTASEKELTGLNGIGPSLASKIARHRATHGSFNSVDALAAVSGIGPKTVDGLRDQAKV